MIRLTLLLLAGLFATMQISGKDNGQMRFGLIEGEKEAAVLAAVKSASDAAEPAPEIVAKGTVAADTPPQPVDVAFTPQPRVVTPAPAPSPEGLGEVQYVSGKSVNVRGGPSTNDEVVGKLSRGDAVTVVWVEDNGWARIRIEGDGVDGYMSSDFLTKVAP